MKNIVLSAAALFVLAGSTFTASAVAPGTATQKVTAKNTSIKTNFIPPVCPPKDPNGCGIFD